ncbi:hypothetical protein EM4838_03055 [Enterococcus mundtii]|uniref:Uncharacterized protein n=1 Tax=Enterococcus mundtii TaxID=53346 RepID=A0A242L1P7_ENTMU|nr:hypothetical protein EM4838_03055 [Enterococcus mundtii]GEN18811.1 hypothetical protein LAC02_20920 [Ligilactobacillus acidipiscis]MRI73513.1 hypothetical protein [Enterococcus mundtii]OTP27740.1 hypothetical protein A5802_001476 [Enterococcus mundtii]RYT05174.1 hypothetical protein EAI87_05380 [Enterococcus mundtii]
MNTNFYPVEVYSSNYRLYSSHSKLDFSTKMDGFSNVILYAVLNLNEIRNIQLKLFIYDIDVEKFATLDQANDRCNELMK